MKLNYVKFRNFLSYGNSFTQFDFNQGLTRLEGKVGVGKSTLIDVIKFALFGKPYRKINKPQLINRVNNSNLYVELSFDKNNHNYIIKRGLKPNIFEIYKDNQLIDQSNHNLKYQDILEQIIGFNEIIFDQVIVKSMTRTISFFTLPKNEKIKMFEKLFISFDLEKIKEILKDKINLMKRDLELLEKDKQNIQSLIEDNNHNINQLNQLLINSQKESENLKQQYKNSLKILKYKYKFYQKYLEIYFKYSSQYNELKQKYNSLLNIKKKIDNRNNLIKQYSENICGNCKKLPKLVDYILNEEISIDEDIDKIIQDVKNNISLIEIKYKKINEINLKLNSIKKTIEFNKQQIKNINNKNVKQIQEQINSLNIKLTNFKIKYNEIIKKIEEINNQYKIYNKIRTNVLTDLRQYIIKTYLPLINNIFNEYLEKLEFNRLRLNSELDLEGMNYYNYSEGEKKKIDIAIILTFLEIFMMKYKTEINVLFLDEITSGLDAYSEEQLLYLLKSFARKTNKEIIIMSHSDISNEFFDRIFFIEKEKGFSKLKQI